MARCSSGCFNDSCARTIPSDAELGRGAYEAYARSTGGKTYDGRDMPAWEALTPKIQTAWTDAAAYVRATVKGTNT